METATKETLERYVRDSEYMKVLQIITNSPKNILELFFLVEAYIGLDRYDFAHIFLKNWQVKLETNYEWAQWCFFEGLCLIKMGEQKNSISTLEYGLKCLNNESGAQATKLRTKIERLLK